MQNRCRRTAIRRRTQLSLPGESPDPGRRSEIPGNRRAWLAQIAQRSRASRQLLLSPHSLGKLWQQWREPPTSPLQPPSLHRSLLPSRLSPQRRRPLPSYGPWIITGLGVLLGWALLKPAIRTNAVVPKLLNQQDAGIVKATAIARSTQRQEQLRQLRPDTYDLTRYPLTDAHESHWRNLLWTTALTEPKQPFVRSAIDQILELMIRPGLSIPQKRTIDMAVQVATQLYLSQPSYYSGVEARFTQAIAQSPEPQWVAMALSGLAKRGMAAAEVQKLVDRVKARFPQWEQDIYLNTTLTDVANQLAPKPLPPMSDLLNWAIAPNQLQIYVLCPGDRETLCQTILKQPNGQFVRQENGQLWSMPLLLRSIHNLGWNFPRGQTPQGVFRIEGTTPQPDREFFRAYGQFPLVNLFVPFESGVQEFLPGKPGTLSGDIQSYQALLPPSWRQYRPMQQSYWAGKVGRRLFRIHGTGDSPDFFSGKEKQPASFSWNPTIGCLSALELYNEDGKLLEADMPKLLQASVAIGGENFKGYLIVVDVPTHRSKPIPLAQIEAAIARKPNALGSHSHPRKSPRTKGVAKSNPAPRTAAIVEVKVKPVALQSSPAKTTSPSASDPSPSPPVAY